MSHADNDVTLALGVHGVDAGDLVKARRAWAVNQALHCEFIDIVIADCLPVSEQEKLKLASF